MAYIKPCVKWSLKSNEEDKKGIKGKEKEHLLLFGLVSDSEGGKTYFRERKSGFSLDFPMFWPSVLIGARGEVGLHCKGYTWTPVLWSFGKLQEVRVFSYLVISCLKCHENGVWEL